MRKYINKQLKFFMLDGLVSLPIVLLAIFPSKPMFIVVMLFTGILIYLRSRGMDVHMLARAIRHFLAGPRRFVRSSQRRIL